MSVLYSEKFAYSFYCSTSAAAGTSMPLARILDTAITDNLQYMTLLLII